MEGCQKFVLIESKKYSLGGENGFLDGTVQKRGDVAGSSVGLILSLGDGQCLEEFLKNTDGLGRLLVGCNGHGRHVLDSRHDFRAGIGF